MPFQNKKVTVTLADADSGLASGEVLFGMTELVLPARHSLLKSGYVVLESEDLSTLDGFGVHFFKKNTTELGTQYGSTGISHDNFQLNEYLGSVQINGGDSSTADAINNLDILQLTQYGDVVVPSPGGGAGGNLNLVLSSAEPDGKVFFSAVVNTVSSTGPVISAGDKIDFHFGFEY